MGKRPRETPAVVGASGPGRAVHYFAAVLCILVRRYAAISATSLRTTLCLLPVLVSWLDSTGLGSISTRGSSCGSEPAAEAACFHRHCSVPLTGLLVCWRCSFESTMKLANFSLEPTAASGSVCGCSARFVVPGLRRSALSGGCGSVFRWATSCAP